MSDKVQQQSVQEVLKLPAAQRMAFFRSRVIGHRRLLDVRDGLMARVRLSGSVQIMVIHGPTGVGKTTMVGKSIHEVQKLFLEEAEQDPDLIPVVYVKANPPETGPFNWHNLYMDILGKLEELYLDQRVTFPAENKISQSSRGRGKSAAEVRRMVLSALRQRKSRVLFVDESQHMRFVASGRTFLAQLDVLKSLADDAGVLIVMIGPDELVQLMELNAQLARRTEICHFGRYRPEIEVERQEFANVVATLASLIPLSEPSDLMKHVPYLYEGSLGLVGTLKTWLDRAVGRALDRQAMSLSESDLQSTIQSAGARLKIAEEIHTYENGQKEEKATIARIRSLLRIDGGAESIPVIPGSNGAPRRTHPVGERKPVRDPVGFHEAA